MTPSRSVALALAVVCGCCMFTQTAMTQELPAGTSNIAFVHTSVIPMDKERILRDHTVVISNGRIAAMGPASTVKVPTDALIVDAAGRYLIPALSDMHVHLLGETWNGVQRPEVRAASKDIPFESFLFPYIANGVTTVLVLSGTAEDMAVRERIRRGELIGPRLILAQMIDGPDKAWPPPISTWVGSPAEAREAVRRAKADGFDMMKAYSFLSQESYDAIISTARELDMKVVGHVPYALSVEYVIDAGQKLIAHSEEIAKHTRGDYSAERIDYFARLMAEKNVWLVPTLVTTQSILQLFDDPDGLLGRPEAAYWRHPMEQGVWSFIAEQLYGPIPAEARQRLRDDFVKFQRPLTKALHDKGGKLLAGSDAPLPGLVPGFSLQRELGELVAVGLTPYEALRTATSAPYEYLGEADRAGTIEVGKHSDLLLLDANPLESVSATAKIAGILMRGRWLPREEIDQRMQDLKTAFAPDASTDHKR